MELQDVVDRLEAMGSERTKRTYFRHGVREPFFGVKIGDLKKLVPAVKKNQPLALALYDTGIHDAMYLAGLSVDPKRMAKERLQAWASQAYWYVLAEYTVAGVAAESPHALELAREWMESDGEMIACAGWSAYAHYMSVAPDERLDPDEIRSLLDRVARTVHQERNRVRYNMNGFVIAAGAFVAELHEEAIRVAETIGKVRVDVGETACKVPVAADAIRGVAAAGRVGVKKKTCIC